MYPTKVSLNPGKSTMRDAKQPKSYPPANRAARGRGRGGFGAAAALTLSAAFALSACQGTTNPFGTQTPQGAPGAIANETPDSRGVITYVSYQVVVARDGDTVATVASRLGIPATELANRNSLPPDYMLRQGEVLLLPDSFPRTTDTLGGAVTTQPLGTGWSPERASEAISGGAPATAPAATANPFQNGQKEPLIDPVRHRVEPGETVYSIARLYASPSPRSPRGTGSGRTWRSGSTRSC